ncbi:HSP70/90 co-chaperone [Coemansia sp. RSA 2706]|nr:HSP70/90 co-chaperone [Coemansia sp. RSA 2706]KAJ2324934.1 HSP70/90 co-chaperone [Coemansia sp. RSA 2702]
MAPNEDAPATVPIGPAAPTVTDSERLEKLNQDLESIPLFMTQLPDEGNEAVEALKTLASEEPPEEMAATYKGEGNLSFKRGRYHDALKHYTHALEYDHDNVDLRVTLLTNRAAVNLELENYGRVLQDCSSALKLKSQTPKALFRAAKACIMLSKFAEAHECCDWVLRMDPGNAELLRLQDEVRQAQLKFEERGRAQEERERQRLARREMLRRAVEIRSRLTFDLSPENAKKKDLYPWEVSEHQVELDHDTGHLLWPVAFLYPESKESDFVQHFDESVTLYDMLAQVLSNPPPWDSQSAPRYTVDNVDTYFMARPVGGVEKDERLVKVSSKLRLASILDNPKYVILDGFPSFLVLPRTGPFTEQYIEHYRQQRLTQEAAKQTVAAEPN